MLYDIIQEDENILKSIVDVFDRRDSGMHAWYYNDNNELYVVIAPDDYDIDSIVVSLVSDIDTLGYPVDSYLEYEYFDADDVNCIRNRLGE